METEVTKSEKQESCGSSRGRFKVVPELGGMELSCNRDSCYDPYGRQSYTIQRDVDMSMAVSFRVVPTSDGRLFAIKAEQ